MSKADDLIMRVLELDAAATPGPWVNDVFGTQPDGPLGFRVTHESMAVACIEEYSRWGDADAAAISDYRSSAPLLARMLQRALEELRSVAVSSSWRIRQDAEDAIEEIEAMA